MKINKVVVLYKLSVYELNKKFGSTSKASPEVISAHEENERSKERIINILNSHQINHTVLHRAENGVPECDLIIAAGGDGTFLEASHHITTQPTAILGINTCPSSSYGHWTLGDINAFEDILIKIIDGVITPVPLTRLKASIGTTIIKERILNEVFVAHPCPAGTSKYEVSVDTLIKRHEVVGRHKVFSENHLSSGIVVGTAAGSTGTMRSMGMEVMDIDSNNWQFCANMPFQDPEFPTHFLKGCLGPKDRLKIKSKTRVMKLWIDGSHVEYDLSEGKELNLEPEYSLWSFVDAKAHDRYKSRNMVACSY